MTEMRRNYLSHFERLFEIYSEENPYIYNRKHYFSFHKMARPDLKLTYFTRIIALAASCILSILTLSAQELPKLKELSERELEEKIVPSVRKGKWGYVNDKDNFRIKAVFEAAEEFKWTRLNDTDSVATAKVKFAGRYAVLNRYGTFLFNPLFDSISDFDRGTAIFTRDGKAGLISALGTVITDGLDEIRPFDQHGLAWFLKDGRWGVIDLAGSIIFENGYDAVPDTMYKEMTLVHSSGKAGLVSMKDRKVLLEPCADSVAFDTNNPELLIYRTPEGLGCINTSGRHILPAKYQLIYSLDDGRIIVKMSDRYGLWDKDGNMLLPSCMYTNQIADDHAFYQIIEERSGRQEFRVHYNDRMMSLGQFDDIMFKELSSTRYNERIDLEYERFPYWLKGHLHETTDNDMLAGQWRFDRTFYPYKATSRVSDPAYGIPQDDESFLEVGKDMKVKEYRGFDFSSGLSLNKAAILIEGISIPCGSWLTPLFRSVDSGKITAYDKAMGTRLFYDWKTISAKVMNRGFAPDGDGVVVLDIMIDGLLMQRVVAKFSTTGTLRYSIKIDGILYDQQEYVNSTSAGCFLTENMLILSADYGRRRTPRTSFYTADGTVITHLDALHIDMLLGNDMTTVRLFGNDLDLYTICHVDIIRRSYTKHSIGMDISKTFFKPIGDHLYFYDRSSRLLKGILDIGSENMPVNALRYADARWDGQRIVGVSSNHWDDIRNAKWTAIPKVSQGSYSENINGQLFTVEAADKDGMAIYSLCPDVWTKEGTRYGFISYEEDFFTQALFEEVKPFENGTAAVKVRGKWHKISKNDFIKYLNSPSEANSADNYETDVKIFTAEQMKKAFTSKAAETMTAEGYRLNRSYGGRLIAFENTYTGKYGFADSTGVMIVPPIYDDFHNCDFSRDGMIAVRKGGSSSDPEYGWGFIDMTGEVVVPCIYNRHWDDNMQSFFSPGENGVSPMCRILSGGSRRMGCVNRKGEIVIPFEYDDISKPVDGVMTAKLGIMTMKLKEDGTML